MRRMGVAEGVMRFKPARLRKRPVKVWVILSKPHYDRAGEY